ncbi:MAG: formate dehydrogenase accessory sulfurtransferase FdhD [Bradyrhizobium sp.]|nr:MAG: formate dehydrogenase accessory sulfurtransferase FdhD [Bradyrhizobium sp.]
MRPSERAAKATRPPPQEARGAVANSARVFRYDSGAVGPVVSCEIAEEIPVEIAFDGAPFAVMMATPLDLEDFAIGFALTEGAVRSLDDIRHVEIDLKSRQARIDITLTPEAMRAHFARKRALSGRTGCGVCGVEDLQHLPSAPRVRPSAPIPPAAIGAAVAALPAAQTLNERTRAAHAAAWAGRDGAVRILREDVGRHNALDKLIGAVLREGADASDGFVLITSRCSFEMVVKTAIFGARTLVAVSAPTTLALETARATGVELIAIARADHALAFDFHHAESGSAT